MAYVEKCCECPLEDCEYHAGLMYEFKNNHLQINPECRDQFKGLTAKLAILSSENKSTGHRTYKSTFRKNSPWTSWCKPEDLEWVNGSLYAINNFPTFKAKDHRGIMLNYDYSIVPVNKVVVFVYVKEHNTVYMNFLNSKKAIRPFLKNMRNLFGYQPESYRNLRFNLTKTPRQIAYDFFNYKESEENVGLKQLILG